MSLIVWRKENVKKQLFAHEENVKCVILRMGSWHLNIYSRPFDIRDLNYSKQQTITRVKQKIVNLFCKPKTN